MSTADAEFIARLNRLGTTLLASIEAFEYAPRQLHPPRIGGLREAPEPLYARLWNALAEFVEGPTPERAQPLAKQFASAARSAEGALRDFCEPAAREESIPRILGAMHQHCQTQALLYPLRKALPPVSHYFLEPPFRDRTAALDPDAPQGEVLVCQLSQTQGNSRQRPPNGSR